MTYPREVWTHRTSALVLAMVLAPLLGTLMLAEDRRTVVGLALVTELVVYPAVLGAAILLYVQYRLTGSNVLGWVTLCLTQYSVQGLTIAALRAAAPDEYFDQAGWVPLIDVPAALLLVVCLRFSGRVRLAIDPVAAGLTAGLLFAAVNLAVNQWGGPLSLASPPVVAAQVALVVLGGAIALAAYRLPEVPRWFAVRLAPSIVALVIHRLTSTHQAEGTVGVVAIAAGLVGAVLMVDAAGASLRSVAQEQRDSLAVLSDQVAALEADERDSRARLHEITSSVASIAVASSLLNHDDAVPADKRHELEGMLDSEANRLTRILGGKGTDALSSPAPGADGGSHHPTRLVDLDEVLLPLVTAQRALQREVDWEPTGHWGLGDPDAVAEAVHILLENSARHAPAARVTIRVTPLGDTVDVAVCDDGPGIPESVRRHLFEWGNHGEDSQGQGIGLHVARRLMTTTGSTLRQETTPAGNAFVISLPAAEENP